MNNKMKKSLAIIYIFISSFCLGWLLISPIAIFCIKNNIPFMLSAVFLNGIALTITLFNIFIANKIYEEV